MIFYSFYLNEINLIMTDIDPVALAKLFEIKKNQLTMMKKRGYDISREAGILQTNVQTFGESYIPFARQKEKSLRAILSQSYMKEDGSKLYVYFADTEDKSSQLKKKEVEVAIAEMTQSQSRDAVIITAKPLSSDAGKHIRSLVAYNIQIFLENEMAYDPTEHFLVPTHIPLSQDEARSFLNTNKISIDDMPILKVDDIIVRYYGLRSGDIVRIERENMYNTMIVKSVSYKVVKD